MPKVVNIPHEPPERMIEAICEAHADSERAWPVRKWPNSYGAIAQRARRENARRVYAVIVDEALKAQAGET